MLRARDGDALDVVDSSGRTFSARVADARGRPRAVLERERFAPLPRRLELTLAQGVPKGAKMDYVVEKATELGVARIVPIATARTIGDGARDGKVERWRRLAKSAAAQCGRREVTEIAEVTRYADFVAALGAYDRVLVPWELAERAPLRERLPGLLDGARRVAIAIGPEGGLSHAEAEAATAAGAELVSLGDRILRTETAGLVACAVVAYACGDL